MEDHAYRELRSDLREDLAVAAAAAASELSGSHHTTDAYEGLMDTLLDSRDRFRHIMANLQGSRLISEVDQAVGPTPLGCVLSSASGILAAERVAAEESADGG